MTDTEDYLERPAVVIDNGSGVIKAGLAENEEPSCMFQSIIGKSLQNKGDTKEYYIGNDTASRRDVLQLTNPVQRGKITNWDDMEKIWDYLFLDQLKIDPSQQGVIMSEALQTPKGQKEKLVQIMFEHFKVPALHTQLDVVLALYALGRVSGTSVLIGDGLTQILPIFEGYPVLDAMKRQEYAGNDVTNYLRDLLNRSGYSFTTAAEIDAVRQIKEQLGYVENDFELAKSKGDKTIKETYKMPDGSIVTVGKERFMCAETVFKPELTGRKSAGIQYLIQDSIQLSDGDLRKDLYSSILIGGGTTMFPGFCDRLPKEMNLLAPKAYRVKVVDNPDRNISVWLGGSILGTMTQHSNLWITHDEYKEYGSNILERKGVI